MASDLRRLLALALLLAAVPASACAAGELEARRSWAPPPVNADTPLESRVPFERAHAVAYAQLLVDLAHRHWLAAAQKNTVELSRRTAGVEIGFDFAIAEECARRDECQGYRAVYGDHVIVIKYRLQHFRKTCMQFGPRLSVVLRDVDVSRPGSRTYRYRAC